MASLNVGDLVTILPTDPGCEVDPLLESYDEGVISRGPWREHSGDCHLTWYDVKASDGYEFEVCGCKLRKKEPPAKREELGEWELCPWRPERVTVGKS